MVVVVVVVVVVVEVGSVFFGVDVFASDFERELLDFDDGDCDLASDDFESGGCSLASDFLLLLLFFFFFCERFSFAAAAFAAFARRRSSRARRRSAFVEHLRDNFAGSSLPPAKRCEQVFWCNK